MANVVVIAKDDRVRRQIELYLQELGSDTIRFATFRSSKEFTDLYFREHKAEENPAPNEDGEGEELKLFSEVHMLIFAMDSIGEKSNPWIDRVRKGIKQWHLWPEGGTTRMVMLKYEDDNISKMDVMHPALDDLIFLPLDRLVFLQKLEIFINLPKRPKPTFLFTQEVKHEIEISKLSKLDRITDVALAIRNPVALKRGLPGHFYLHLPDEKRSTEIFGKVIRSIPHPDYPGQFLVYFAYFGLSKNGMASIRRFLSKSARYHSLADEDRAKFRFLPDDLFVLPSEQHVFGAVAIDTDDGVAKNLAQQLCEEMDRLKVSTEESYSVFLHKYFGNKSTAEDIRPEPTEESDFYHPNLQVNLSVSDGKCMSVDPGPPPNGIFLGHKAADIFASPDKWLSLLADEGSRLILLEALALASFGKPSDKLLLLKDGFGRTRAIRLKLTKGTEDLVTAFLRPASTHDITGKLGNEERAKQLDAMIINSAFVPSDISTWSLGLRTQAAKAGLMKDFSELRFLLLADTDTKVESRFLNAREILGMVYKPVETRQLLFLLSEFLPNKNTLFHFENLGWSSPSSTIHAAKEMEMEAISEYGATLKSKYPLAAGTIVYLRKSIFVNAPNECLAARVYACEPHPSEKDMFAIYLTYFGINDQFLKFARTWIRENYAHQKSGE